MDQEVFFEKARKLQKLLCPKKYGYGGPLVFAGQKEKVVFFTIVSREGDSFRETVHVVWAGDNGNLRQEEVSSLMGFFKTSLEAKVENGTLLLNVCCEEGDVVQEFNFRIPRNIVAEWCRRERPDKEIIIN